MKKIVLFISVVLCVACNFETKKISSEEVLEHESHTLNWREVDEYPAFKECENLTELAEAKNCFEKKVSESIYSFLSRQQPVVTESIDDTLYLYLEIDKKGRPQIDSISVDSLVIKQLPEIQTWLKESIGTLPKIYPANKRGVPVSTVFKMPVVIKAE